MSVSIVEYWDSEEFNLAKGDFFNGESTCAKTFVVRGVSGEAEACSLAYYAADKYIKDMNGENSIPRSSASIVERSGADCWKVRVEYRYMPANQSFDTEADDGRRSGTGGGSDNDNMDLDMDGFASTHSFDCSTGSMHKFIALAQWMRWSSDPADATKIANKVNLSNIPVGATINPDDEPSGIDIPCPVLMERYTIQIPKKVAFSAAWKKKMAAYHGCVNMGKYHGYDTGEVMFTGCSFNAPFSGTDKVTVDFNFSIVPTESAAVVAGHSIGNVKGHDYVWAMYEPGADGYKQVAKVFVAQMHVYKNLQNLGV